MRFYHNNSKDSMPSFSFNPAHGLNVKLQTFVMTSINTRNPILNLSSDCQNLKNDKIEHKLNINGYESMLL